MSFLTSSPSHKPLLSTGSNMTVPGYCAHMLLLWIQGYERLVGFDVAPR